jgi:MinD-like ATPase involved in chromosome partitioning or flagellar assembly
VIPEDDSVKKSLNKRDAVIHTHPKSKASKKYREIAEKISGNGNGSKKPEGVFSKLLSFIGENK